MRLGGGAVNFEFQAHPFKDSSCMKKQPTSHLFRFNHNHGTQQLNAVELLDFRAA